MNWRIFGRTARLESPIVEKERLMSTHFALSQKLSSRELFGGRLEHSGIREHVSPNTNERTRCLTDGRNYLWVDITEDGLVVGQSRYGMNAPVKILSAIAETFDTRIFSEYEPEFWGFDTQEARGMGRCYGEDCR